MKLPLLMLLHFTLMAIASGEEEEEDEGSWGRVLGLPHIDQSALFKGMFDPTNVAISLSLSVIGFVARNLGLVAVAAVANAATSSSSKSGRQFEGGDAQQSDANLVRLLPSSGGSWRRLTKKVKKRRTKREARGTFDVSQVVIILRTLADAAARFERFIDEL